MLSLFGAGIGRGIAIGSAYVLKNSDIDVPHFSIQVDQVKNEITRFEKALKETNKQYKKIKKELPSDAPIESAAFINAYLLMLSDPLLVTESKKIIKSDLVNAEYALSTQSQNLIQVFESMEDDYLRNKKTDVLQITNRILRNLLHLTTHVIDSSNQDDLKGRIIVGKDLTPAETMYIKNRKVVAFITDLGSQISHTAIVARSLQIPAVVGLHGSSKYIHDDDLLVVDGKRGIIIINPTDKVLKQYKCKRKHIKEQERELDLITKKSSKTLDGDKIHLLANIESAKDIKLVKKVNAAGVGLFRTEYLYMGRDKAPSENEQFKAYKQVVQQLGKPVTIRTLDIGGDKQLNFDYPQKASSISPLGLRAVRLCLNNMELFKPQLRAILRASAYGKISLLIPMVSNLGEVNQVLAIIKATKLELKLEKIKFDSRMKVGAMIEVPAAAIQAEKFAKKLDFLSIGTNDLIQYTLAIDRVDDAVNYLYDPIHPAVLSLIENVISAGNKAGIPVSLCGEMAANENYTRLLLSLGLKVFSMDATYLLAVKKRIISSKSTLSKCHVNALLAAENSSQAKDILTKINKV